MDVNIANTGDLEVASHKETEDWVVFQFSDC